MSIKTYSVAPFGLESLLITVEVSIMTAMPSFQIVGLPDKAVNEAKERVRAALLGCGISLPAKKILVNLAPADLPKEGGRYDLPIALALLSALEIIPINKISELVSIGELRLDGSIDSGHSILLAAVAAHTHGYTLVCSQDSAHELADVTLPDPIISSNLLNLMNILNGKTPIPTLNFQDLKPPKLPHKKLFDMSYIRGQETAKHALEITASGGHNLLLSGPPGAGKSTLASCLPDILPPPSKDELYEIALIASASGNYSQLDLKQRPYRAPHHSASMAALIGGGRKASPGEITLAHAGVLFLDELPEFKADVLDSLRQPLETGEVMISRAERRITYPCRFQLIAAMNPCKCGYLGDTSRECHKAPHCGQYYTSKLSGPLLDRFGIRLHLSPVSLNELTMPATGETSETIKARVIKAQNRQFARYQAFKHLTGSASRNAYIKSEFFNHVCQLTDRSQTLIQKAIERFNLTARGYHLILRTARTLQDIEDVKSDIEPLDNKIDIHNIATAINFRHD